MIGFVSSSVVGATTTFIGHTISQRCCAVNPSIVSPHRRSAPTALFGPERSADAMTVRFESLIFKEQEKLLAKFEQLEGSKFQSNTWKSNSGASGISKTLHNGKIFDMLRIEALAVDSVMKGKTAEIATSKNLPFKAGFEKGSDVPFTAVNFSVIAHPNNPLVPSMHFNMRYFEVPGGLWWFGGGMDLTPSYVIEENVTHFHKTLKESYDRHDKSYYPAFKKWCDDYFYDSLRGEHRGIGGTFFDDLNDKPADQIFDFLAGTVGCAWDAYAPIVQKRKDTPYTEEQKKWQELRLGRYVEFNLTQDRGTQFGVDIGVPINILYGTLPAKARWDSSYTPASGSEEEKTLELIKSPKEWA